MAKIIKKTSDLEEGYMKYKKLEKSSWRKQGLSVVGMFAGLLLFLLGREHSLCVFIALIVFGVSVLFFVWNIAIYPIYANKAKIRESGIEGELTTSELIQSLPEEYYGFSNVKVTYEDQTSELDMIVVGPGGIFVIETKNLNGEIRGTYTSRNWVQRKVGRGGTPYSNEFYSPVKQIGTHIYRLANFLRDNGVFVYVNGAVYFSNVDAKVEVLGESNGIPVFSCWDHGEELLRDYILADEKKLNAETIEKVCKLLS